MIVEIKVVGERPTNTEEHGDLQVEVPATVSTFRELVDVLVRHELAGYERRRDASRALRVLTPADLARGVDTGRYGQEARGVAAAPSPEVAVARAEEAFVDGLFFAFLDERQITALDEPVTVSHASRLRLVRLVALAGG